MPAICQTFNQTERLQLRRAAWLHYTFGYDTAGVITHLRLVPAKGAPLASATDRHLQHLIRQYVRVYVPKYLKTAVARPLRTAGLYLPGQKLACQ